MMQLTDSMISEALENSGFANRNPWEMMIIASIVVIVFAVTFILVKIKTIKILSVILAVLFIIIGITSTTENLAVKKAIQNEEWIVVTDTVDRVMEQTSNGNKSYFLILETYGRVSLDGYLEAIRYYPGAEFYVVVVPDGDDYIDTGIAYSKKDYTYVGSH